MATSPVPIETVSEQLTRLGVERGGVLLVHTAFSKVRPVEGGPSGLIAALRAALGPAGTLVMPSFTDDDDHSFERGSTPCAGVGIVADTFWRLSGVLRSDSPHAFAAVGPKASAITAPHPADDPHCPNSPVGRVYAFDGRVLLLGVEHDVNTTIHLAEAMAGVRYRRKKHATIGTATRPERVDYAEIDHCCERFRLMDGWLDSAGCQRRGTVAQATARLARSRHIVAAALERLRTDETVFLHPYGIDAECDEARASLSPQPSCAQSK